MRTLTGGSFFSGGIDGLGIAASLAEFDILYHVEYDDWRRKVLEKHAWLWPNSVQHKDITQLTADQLQPVDVLFGGFPCQDVSLAGRRAGLAEGTRSGLWFHFRRLIGDLRPRAVVIENTTGLLSLGGTTVIEDLRALGYVGSAGVISAADAGAPHLRERVFIVAYAGQNRQPGTNPQTGQGADSQERFHPVQEPEHDRTGQHVANPSEPSGLLCREKLAVADEGRRAGASNVIEGAGTSQRRRYLDRRHSQGRGSRSTESRVGRNPDGITPRLDGFRGFPAYQNQPQYPDEPPRVVAPKSVKDRIARVEALGDSVVWRVAYPIFYYLRQALGLNYG